MPKSRSRGKKHNPNKRSRGFFTGTTIWTWEGLRDVNDEPLQRGMLQTARGYEELEPRIIAGVMYQPCSQWFFFVRALCRTPSGTTWVSRSGYKTISGRLHGNGNKYWALRDDVLAKQRLDQVVDVGWIAQLYRGPSPEHDAEKMEAMRLFETGGITDYRQSVWRYVQEEIVNDPSRRAA